MIRLVLLAIVIVLSSRGAQAVEPHGLHSYVAFGNNYNFPGSIRLGWEKWEFGLLSMGIYGAVKRNYFMPSYYTSFGPIAVGVRDTIGFGFIAGMGFDYYLLWGLGFRGEIMGTVEHNGHLDGRGNLGLSFDI